MARVMIEEVMTTTMLVGFVVVGEPLLVRRSGRLARKIRRRLARLLYGGRWSCYPHRRCRYQIPIEIKKKMK